MHFLLLQTCRGFATRHHSMPQNATKLSTEHSSRIGQDARISLAKSRRRDRSHFQLRITFRSVSKTIDGYQADESVNRIQNRKMQKKLVALTRELADLMYSHEKKTIELVKRNAQLNIELQVADSARRLLYERNKTLGEQLLAGQKAKLSKLRYYLLQKSRGRKRRSRKRTGDETERRTTELQNLKSSSKVLRSLKE
ncbi:hypothetical protein BJ742DRAFT_503662 [Cladochytrium replicatum]|nr:hypothetical protein BJ742DRAFT_503662 [Cladochytrium replicatum]